MQAIAIPLGAVLALVSVAAVPAHPVPVQAGSLQRVMPQEGADDPGADLLAPFDEGRWRARLTSADLDRRERAYDALLKRAGFDPAARLFLEELARDGEAGELAWTARLALRELGRPRFPVGAGRLPGAIQSPLQGLMQELFERDGSPYFAPPGARPGPAPRAGVSGRSIHLEQGSGRTVLEIVEQVDGKERRSTYEGESVDAILEANPELRDQLGGLQLRIGAGGQVDLDLDLPRGLTEALGNRGAWPGQPLTPQRPAEPVTTEKFGIIAHPLTEEHGSELGLEKGVGLFVERTAPGTYAHLLGIGSGDVLVQIDDQVITSVEDVGRVMAAHDPKTSIRATWIDELGQRRSRAWPPEAATPRPR